MCSWVSLYKENILRSAQHMPIYAGNELKGRAYGILRTSKDFATGVKAFNEKTKAKWGGT